MIDQRLGFPYNRAVSPLKLPADLLARFRAFGREGGKLGGSAGGKKAAANMTAKQRRDRAKKASAAAVKARAKK